MEGDGGNKVSGISQVVKLKEMLQKWQAVTLNPRANPADENNDDNEEEEPRPSTEIHTGIPPAISRRLKSTTSFCDSDEDCQSPETPFDVPKGYLAVYVGPELPHRRFIIPTTYLTHPLFEVLLEKVEEEFGFDHCGGLTIPCEVETFKYLLNCMENHQHDHEPQLDNEAAETSLTAETAEE